MSKKGIDFRPSFWEVWDQRPLSSCTACAVSDAYSWEWNQLNAGKGEPFIGSPHFLYYNARKKYHCENKNIGLKMEDCLYAAREFGLCSSEVWPLEEQTAFRSPPPGAYTEAERFPRPQTMPASPNAYELKDLLAAGHPVYFTFRIYPEVEFSFIKGSIAKTGKMGKAPKTLLPSFNHAMLLVGFDDQAKRWIVRNSFGTAWGAKGHLLMQYDYLTDSAFSFDHGWIKL